MVRLRTCHLRPLTASSQSKGFMRDLLRRQLGTGGNGTQAMREPQAYKQPQYTVGGPMLPPSPPLGFCRLSRAEAKSCVASTARRSVSVMVMFTPVSRFSWISSPSRVMKPR